MDRRLDPDVRQILKASEGQPPFHALGVAQARQQMRESALRLPKADCLVMQASAESDGYEVPLRLYKPAEGRDFPIMVWLHGGGFILGDLDTHDALCRELANEARCLVVSVGYRLAPEFPFPTPVKDSVAAVRWAATEANGFGGDGRRLLVGGDSAGGTLAAASSLYLSRIGFQRIAGLILVYPTVDTYDPSRSSYREFAEGFHLTASDMAWFWNLYLRSGCSGSGHVAVPIRADNLYSLPPTYVLTAELDVLRDEAEEFHETIKMAGVESTLVRGEGMIHGFIRWRRLSMAADTLFQGVCSWARGKIDPSQAGWAGASE